MKLLVLLLIAVPCLSQMIGRAPFYVPLTAAAPAASVIVEDSASYLDETAETWYANYIYCRKIPMTTKGAVQYVSWFKGVANSADMRSALYTHNAATNRPNEIIDSTATVENVTDSTWAQFVFSSPPTVTDDTVWIAVWMNANIVVYRTVENEGRRLYTYMARNYTSAPYWPATYSTDDVDGANRKQSAFIRVQP